MVDVAQACGLALSTVSSALNGTGSVSERTRQRVAAVAKSMGYRPNVHAAVLAHGRKRAVRSDLVPVAVLFNGRKEENGSWLKREWMRSVVPEVDRFSFELIHLEGEIDGERLSRRLYQRGVAGIILSRMLRKPELQGFDWSLFAVVQEGGRCLAEWPFDQVRPSPANTVRYLLRLAWERGYRRPGCVFFTHEEEIDEDEIRLGEALGFNQLRVRKRPVPPLTTAIARDRQAFLDDRRRLLAWFAEHRPDCVIGFNAASYHILRYCGVRFPEDAGFLSSELHFRDPEDDGISGLWETHQEVIREALERLMYLIHHNRKGVPDRRTTIIVDPVFREGITLPRRRQPTQVGPAMRNGASGMAVAL